MSHALPEPAQNAKSTACGCVSRRLSREGRARSHLEDGTELDVRQALPETAPDGMTNRRKRISDGMKPGKLSRSATRSLQLADGVEPGICHGLPVAAQDGKSTTRADLIGYVSRRLSREGRNRSHLEDGTELGASHDLPDVAEDGTSFTRGRISSELRRAPQLRSHLEDGTEPGMSHSAPEDGTSTTRGRSSGTHPPSLRASHTTEPETSEPESFLEPHLLPNPAMRRGSKYVTPVDGDISEGSNQFV